MAGHAAVPLGGFKAGMEWVQSHPASLRLALAACHLRDTSHTMQYLNSLLVTWQCRKSQRHITPHYSMTRCR